MGGVPIGRADPSGGPFAPAPSDGRSLVPGDAGQVPGCLLPRAIGAGGPVRSGFP